jgi:nicotinamide riboside kinase
MPDTTLRVYMVGAHSTGKTTLARWVRDTFGLPMISEVARGVLAEMEAQLDALRSNIEVVNRYQREVFERQITAELAQPGSFVSDRAFCNLAYAAHHSQVLPELARDERLARYMEFVREGLVFFVRPHRALVAHDGVRAGVEWEEVVRIDGMVKLMLEWFGIPYIPMESLSMQERVRHIERVLSLTGLQKVAGATGAEIGAPAVRPTGQSRPTLDIERRGSSALPSNGHGEAQADAAGG